MNALTLRDFLYRSGFKFEQMVAFARSTRTPISLTLDLFKLKRHAFVAITNDGIKLRLEPSCGESFTFFENLVRRDYLPPSIKLSSGDTVVDIGANIGSFAVLAGTLIGPEGRVIAFEPVPATYERLKKNIDLNGLHNVECTSAAIDDRDGEMRMLTSPKSAWSTLHPRDDQKQLSDALSVPTITLARVFADNKIDRINLMKVDCEGSEYGIFETLPADLAPRIDQIAMEVHELDGKSPDSLAAHLESLGFSVTRNGCNWFAVRSVS